MASALLLVIALLILSVVVVVIFVVITAAIAKRNMQSTDSPSPYPSEPTWESVGSAFRLAPVEHRVPNTDAYAGTLGGYSVRVVRIKPWRAVESITYKTEIATDFAQPPRHQFIVHGKAKFLRGDYFPTGDAVFDDQFVVRSDAGPAVLPLFNDGVRTAITAYNASVPSLNVSNKGVEVLIEGAIPPLATIGDILRAQAQVVAAIETAGSLG